MSALRAAVTVVLVVAAISSSAAEAANRPNILWIVADDMSPDMGCYGDDYAWTPNLDALAAQGARYTRAFAVNGQCAPSRSALVTGMYPTSIGTHHMRSQGVPPEYVRLLTYYLRAAGYYCSNNGKADYNLGTGSTVNSGILRSPTGMWNVEGTQAHWRSRSPNQPFFAVFNLAQTHESRLHFPDERFEKVVERVPSEQRHDPAKADLPAYYPDDPVFRSDWAKYHDLVSAMDVEAGDLLAQLEEDGLADNTIVFFFGDHGRPLPRAKRWLYDSGLQVPLIVRWPGTIAPGSVVDNLVSFVDFAPTVLRLADIPIPAYMQGRAFLPRNESSPREYVYAQRDRVDEVTDRVRSVRGPRYHYIRNYYPEIPYAYPLNYMDRMPSMQQWRALHQADALSGPPALFFNSTRPSEELYDTHTDPDEVRNLATDPALNKVRTVLANALDAWIDETGDLGGIPEDDLLEQWRPNGEWTVCDAPTASDSGEDNSGRRSIELTTATPGGVIFYRLGNSRDWHLYSDNLSLEPGTEITAITTRLGFRDSPESNFHVATP